MPGGVSVEEAGRRYAEESLRCFIDGGKYARDGKPKSIRWLIGVIDSSGATSDELKDMLDKARHYPKTIEEGDRFDEAKRKVEQYIEQKVSYDKSTG